MVFLFVELLLCGVVQTHGAYNIYDGLLYPKVSMLVTCSSFLFSFFFFLFLFFFFNKASDLFLGGRFVLLMAELGRWALLNLPRL